MGAQPVLVLAKCTVTRILTPPWFCPPVALEKVGRVLVEGFIQPLSPRPVPGLSQVSTGNLLVILSRHYQDVSCLKFTGDSSHFVSGGKDCLVLVWNLCR